MKRKNRSFWLTFTILIVAVLTLTLAPVVINATTSPPVTVNFIISTDWGTGCNYSVMIKNNTPEMIPGGWRLSWTFIGDQKLIYPNPPIIIQTGSDVVYISAPYQSIPANGTIYLGFTVSGTGRGVTNVKFNGVPVSGAR